ncbi:2-C-methyl-D-erythritol 2,4-cyclodiphosphate synthase [bacterium]|nr:2-C-methyl-D-erythritol 2,4-cyclodiphosphate synthase [bacterium]RQV94361.1 MAG: 2-C-methyl-D-erythritol 2,4-cyclodiphosphate synthase [bacterium]
MRVGFGYDLHPLVEGRPLVLGGISIPSDKGLMGHSDADVLCHAIADGLLGAAALGDIGEHFPDTDPIYKNASSVDLLNRVGQKVNQAGYWIQNIDSTIVAEAPKLQSHKSAMIKKIAAALDIDPGIVSVKATTHEGLGPVGQGEAIVAYALVSIEEKTK